MRPSLLSITDAHKTGTNFAQNCFKYIDQKISHLTTTS